MFVRLLPAVAALVIVPLGVAQEGLYGKPTGHPKAGDPAPDLAFARLLSAPVPGSWTQANLSGSFTVLSFFPDTSHNPEPVAAWNERVARFAGKPVQFVWITGEPQESLMPALARHPVKGWVLYDPDGATGKAFGLDMPVNVYIGPDRRILGFQEGYIPDENTLNAVLESRTTHTRPTPATIEAFMQSRLVVLDAEPAKMPRSMDHRPGFPPSETVHITPSDAGARGNSSAEDFLSLRGYTVKEAVERLYHATPVQVLLPRPLDTTQTFNFDLVLPAPESHEKMEARMKEALLEHFHLTAEPEHRLVDVYVVSTAPGQSLRAEKNQDHMVSRSSGVGIRAPHTSAGPFKAPGPQSIEAIYSLREEGTMDDLCRDLESTLDRPVVNETGLEGVYRFQVAAPPDGPNDFLQRLRRETGLVITSGQRNVQFLRLDEQ